MRILTILDGCVGSSGPNHSARLLALDQARPPAHLDEAVEVEGRRGESLQDEDDVEAYAVRYSQCARLWCGRTRLGVGAVE